MGFDGNTDLRYTFDRIDPRCAVEMIRHGLPEALASITLIRSETIEKLTVDLGLIQEMQAEWARALEPLKPSPPPRIPPPNAPQPGSNEPEEP